MAQTEEYVRVFKALIDENRIRILLLLRDGEKCAGNLLVALKIQQPTLSHHMKLLCGSGLVTWRKEGKWTHYSLSPAGGSKAQQLLSELLLAPPGENS